MAVIVPVYFDYASSLCYIAWRIAAKLTVEVDVEMRWHPVHIAAQHPGWSGRAASLVETRVPKSSAWRRRRQSRYVYPKHWLDSRAALEGVLFAEEHGCATAYHREVFAAAYEREEDIGDRAVLVRAAANAGLPIGRFMESVATRRGASSLALIREEAQQLGVVGVSDLPAWRVSSRGIQPYETMKLLVARHVERTRDELQ